MFCFRDGLSALESRSQNLDEIGKDIIQKSSLKMAFMGSENSQVIVEAALKALYTLTTWMCLSEYYQLFQKVSINITAVNILCLCNFLVAIIFSCLSPRYYIWIIVQVFNMKYCNPTCTDLSHMRKVGMLYY